MGLLKRIFAKKAGTGVSNVLDSVGNLATSIRAAITGDMPPEVRANLLSKLLDLTLEVTKTQAGIINTESQGNFLQRTWRPLTMLTFLILIVLAALKLVDLSMMDVPKEMWSLLTIGIGGYIGGRSLEKIVTNIKGK